MLATLLVIASAPVLYAKERILLHRIDPHGSTLFIAKTDSSDERPLLPNSFFDYDVSFSADERWIVFTSERSGSAEIYRVHPDGSGHKRLTDDPAYDDQAGLSPDGKQLASRPPAVRAPLTFECSTCKLERHETLRTRPPVSGRPGPWTGVGLRSHRTATHQCDG